MNNLKALANIVRGIRLKSSDFLVLGKSKESKINTFFNKVVEGDFHSDQDASHFFYDSEPDNSSYKNLKSSLREKMVNTTLFFDYSNAESGFAKASIYCIKYLAAAQVIKVLGSGRVCADLCKRVIKKAQEYELTEYILKSADILRSFSLMYDNDKKKFEHYNKLLRHYSKVLDAEYFAAELYYRLVIPFAKSASTDLSIATMASDFHDQLKPYLDKFDSPRLHFMGYYIETIKYHKENNYQKVLSICEEAIAYFEKKTYTYNAPMRAFLHYSLLCHIQLKDFQNGKLTSEKSNKYTKIGSNNWYVQQELILILAFHSKEYQEAYGIAKVSTKHRKFKKLSPSKSEKWTIYEAYVNFLIFIEKIKVDDAIAKSSKYKQGKFLNSIPVYSKDKRGLNVSSLIIQIVFVIVKKDYDQAIDRIEAIEKYCSRYLRKDENFRSNCFIKALLQVPISGFHKAGVERRAKKYIEQLNDVPLEMSNQPYEVEIIPYEDLWQIIMDSLGVKFLDEKLGQRNFNLCLRL